MHVDHMYGPTAPERGWVPAPRYLMRRARVLELTKDLSPGDLLEVGAGAGMLLQEFARRGFRCAALEPSVAASDLARELAHEAGLPIELHTEPRPDWGGRFDVLVACEVLEHIEDDRGALSLWHSWLRPGGQLVLSVPAHQRLWTAGDQWAGHFRRYERNELRTKLAGAGFELQAFECYGYPITNLSEKLSARGYARRIHRAEGDEQTARQANNDRSGIDRAMHVRMYSLLTSPFGRAAIGSFLAAQKLFLNTDLGSGYVVRAHRA